MTDNPQIPALIQNYVDDLNNVDLPIWHRQNIETTLQNIQEVVSKALNTWNITQSKVTKKKK